VIRVTIYFEDSLAEPVELAGLSKRINAIGLQPIPGDQFSVEDLNREDREKIERFEKRPVECLIVMSRQFKFETNFPAIYIKLRPS
jgi:hypothetical protein